MPYSSLRFGYFCEFRPQVCFSAYGSKRFEILPFSSGSLTPFNSAVKSGVFLYVFVNLKGNLVFLHKVKKTEFTFKSTKKAEIPLT
ncbi:hypothetical protein Hanom_Chr13g01195361 [Helianthus anomalus]